MHDHNKTHAQTHSDTLHMRKLTLATTHVNARTHIRTRMHAQRTHGQTNRLTHMHMR